MESWARIGGTRVNKEERQIFPIGKKRAREAKENIFGFDRKRREKNEKNNKKKTNEVREERALYHSCSAILSKKFSAKSECAEKERESKKESEKKKKERKGVERGYKRDL